MKVQNLYAVMAGTLQGFFKDIEVARETSVGALSAHLTPDCQRIMGPSTFLTAAQLPADLTLNNTAYEGLMVGELSVTASNGFTVSDAVIDVKSRKASAMTTYHVTLCGPEPRPHWDLSLTWFFDLTEDGCQIKRIVELLDPQPVLEEATAAAELVAQGVKC
jgi:hypothetical protein